MQGQWIGQFNSQHPGQIVVNVDEMPGCYQAVAFLAPNAAVIPRMMVMFRTSTREPDFDVDASWMAPLHPDSGMPVQWDNIRSRYASDITMSRTARIVGSVENGVLSVRWGTDIGLIGQCELKQSSAEAPSALKPEVVKWKDYRKLIEGMRGRRLVFRGQSDRWRLRTLFHRSGRADLHRYYAEDVPQLRKHLSSRTKHLFNLDDGVQSAAFLSLVQHHGYPTPLLDWTHSPYVAAFFAFRGLKEEKKRAKKYIRILTFDLDKWVGLQQLPQAFPLLRTELHLTVADVLAIENERLIPQQGVSLMSNVDDIESYIGRIEENFGVQVLNAIDIPTSERDLVLDELRYMGITAASMFPGLDGMCEDLRARNFAK